MSNGKGSENKVKKHFNRIAKDYDHYKEKNHYYYDQLKNLLKEIIKNSEDMNILEIGCGTGDVISSLMPKQGMGIDISEEMITIARTRHQTERNLRFEISDHENSNNKIHYDYILLVDLVEHLTDVNIFFSKLKNYISPETKVIMTSANKIWEPIFYMAEKLSLKMPEGPHNWQNFSYLRKLFRESNFRELEFGTHLLVPIPIPLLSEKLNRNFRRYRFSKDLGVIKYLVLDATN